MQEDCAKMHQTPSGTKLLEALQSGCTEHLAAGATIPQTGRD